MSRSPSVTGSRPEETQVLFSRDVSLLHEKKNKEKEQAVLKLHFLSLSCSYHKSLRLIVFLSFVFPRREL